MTAPIADGTLSWGDFDLTGPLPEQGTTVLQASAGTGKTYAIASLAARYVAEGVPLDRILMVTFGRAATAELRDRVRSRLRELHAMLVSGNESEDPVAALLAEGSQEDLALRVSRLAGAVADFDSATISTTHGFCAQMLRVLGLLADTDESVTLVETAWDLVDDIAADLFVGAYGRSDSEVPQLSFSAVREIARDAVRDPIGVLEPTDEPAGTVPAVRVSLATRVRSEYAARKRRGRIQDYDDLQLALARALRDPVTGPVAVQRLRERYEVVLVDEFQDTDPVQWRILSQLFHNSHVLVLIGDPKQAIYSFRGGDVDTYLQATEQAAAGQTLAVNRRADAALLAGLEAIFGAAALGDPTIAVAPVVAHHRQSRLAGAAPVRLRVVDRIALPPPTGRGQASTADLRSHIARDVAADIVELLSSPVTLSMAEDAGARPVGPRDIAVLVRKNSEGALVRDALLAAGVPVVLSGTSSVFSTGIARDWLTLLAALEQPQRSDLARAAALTAFVGWTATDLATAGDERLDAHSVRLRSWSRIAATRGIAALLETITATTDLAARVLAAPEGERRLTDLRHIGQTLHVEATRRNLGLASQISWLGKRIEEAAADIDDERSRRLESEAAAVQVVTVHRSKGLEYPIVYAPFLWDRWVNDKRESLLLHRDHQRIRDLGGPRASRYRDRWLAYEQEDADEDLRLAYVALTRAQCQVVLWWAPAYNAATSALHRLLFAEREHTVAPGAPTTAGEPAEGRAAPQLLSYSVGVPTDQQAWARFEALRIRGAPHIEVAQAQAREPAVWQPLTTTASTVQARAFDRELDLSWRRTSYSGLTAGLHELSVGHSGSTSDQTSEPENPGTIDEPTVLGEVMPARPAMPTAPPTSKARPIDATGQEPLESPMGDLPRGADFGTLAHSVYENLDFTSVDLPTALFDRCVSLDSMRRAGVAPQELAAAMLPSFLTPLGPLAQDRRLADLPLRDVLSELEYEYPLGTATGRRILMSEVADLLRIHLAADDPMRAYAEDLSGALADTVLRGYLGGFIDAVLRVEVDGAQRFVVVDYKTNWLGSSENLTTETYDRASLVAAMREAHYPLQALLYSVALHRFLRWRLPGYDPQVNLGGVLYLFVRGMCGPDTPRQDGVPAGVFSWALPPTLVVALSDLLADRLPTDLIEGGSDA